MPETIGYATQEKIPGEFFKFRVIYYLAGIKPPVGVDNSRPKQAFLLIAT